MKYLSGVEVGVYDDDPKKGAQIPAHIARLDTLADLESRAAQRRENEVWLRAPSMNPDHPALRLGRNYNRHVTTFTSYWIDQHKESVLATITGTKGKSTTTSLCGAILDAAGISLRIGGNIGVVPDAPPMREKWLFETSSFQLHDCMSPAPCHAITSLFPEHLDWHGGMSAYIEAKLRPYRLDPTCVAIVPKELASRLPDLNNPQVIVEQVVHWKDGHLVVNWQDTQVPVPMSQSTRARLMGDDILNHNFSVAVVVALVASGLPVNQCATAAGGALEGWIPLPSRQNVIGVYADRVWVDDALATIPQATVGALTRWSGSTVRLILGGKDRQQDFSPLVEYLNEHTNVWVYAYGDTTGRLKGLLNRPIVVRGTFLDALDQAYQESSPSDVLLFSPAGATPETGENYQTRAAKFRDFALKTSKA